MVCETNQTRKLAQLTKPRWISFNRNLDQEMQSLVMKMPIVDEVKFALCGGKNDFYHYIMLARAFESGTWMKVRKIADTLKLDQRVLHGLFNQAVVWGNSVRQSVSPHYPKTQA